MKVKRTLVAVFLSVGCAMSLSGQQKAPKLEAEVLSITDKYIHPAQISRPVGPFVLIVKNHSRLKQLVIQIKRHGVVTNLVNAALDDVNGNFDTLLDLPAGTYDLSEPANSSLKCTITLK